MSVVQSTGTTISHCVTGIVGNIDRIPRQLRSWMNLTELELTISLNSVGLISEIIDECCFLPRKGCTSKAYLGSSLSAVKHWFYRLIIGRYIVDKANLAYWHVLFSYTVNCNSLYRGMVWCIYQLAVHKMFLLFNQNWLRLKNSAHNGWIPLTNDHQYCECVSISHCDDVQQLKMNDNSICIQPDVRALIYGEALYLLVTIYGLLLSQY